MNAIDIVFSLIIAYGLISGFINGFIKSAANFIAIGLAIWIGINFSNLLESFVAQQDFIPDSFIKIVAFIVTLVLVVLSVKLIAKVLHTIVHTIGLGIFNRIGGAFFGVLLYVFGLAAASYYLMPILSNFLEPELIAGSVILKPMLELVEVLKISLF